MCSLIVTKHICEVSEEEKSLNFSTAIIRAIDRDIFVVNLELFFPA